MPQEKQNLKVGDRVIVSGKNGTLKYIGPMRLKEVNWAGVELDDPLDDNDRSVEGQR